MLTLRLGCGRIAVCMRVSSRESQLRCRPPTKNSGQMKVLTQSPGIALKVGFEIPVDCFGLEFGLAASLLDVMDS